MSGYNKEDVNNYILSLNRTIEETRKHNEKTLADYNERAEDADKHILELESELMAEKEKNQHLEKSLCELSTIRYECEAKDEELSSLRALVAQLEEKIAGYEAQSDGEKEKAEHYDSLCSKAGEILVIASSTAEDILNRANTEALKIVGDANTKKDLMLKTFSESVDAAADDINSYIRSAVDRCVVKINESVREVSKMAGSNDQAPAVKKPKTIFINSNK